MTTPMPVRGHRQTFTASVTLNGSGAGQADITMVGDVLIFHVRVSAQSDATHVPTATVYLNGTEFEGSDTGNSDQSDTTHLMLSQDVMSVVWAGGVPNTKATFWARGIQYPAGYGEIAVAQTGG